MSTENRDGTVIIDHAHYDSDDYTYPPKLLPQRIHLIVTTKIANEVSEADEENRVGIVT